MPRAWLRGPQRGTPGLGSVNVHSPLSHRGNHATIYRWCNLEHVTISALKDGEASSAHGGGVVSIK